MLRVIHRRFGLKENSTQADVLPSTQPRSRESLLDVRNLRVTYRSGHGQGCVAISGANLNIAAGEIVGVYGPSGSGKSSLGLALLDLLPRNAIRSAEAIYFHGRDLQKFSARAMRRIRGREIAIMYQEPALALNPVMHVGDQIAEVIRAHQRIGRKEIREKVSDLLRSVCLDQRPGIYHAYPHELSGGECHRIVIAQAIACRPSLVIADEPTAGLDAELKPEIVDLLARLRTEFNISFLLISHDRKMLARVADRMLEMSAGHLEQPQSESLDIVCTSGSARTAERRETEPLVLVRGLSKTYKKRGLTLSAPSKSPALQNVNLDIPRGSIMGLVGPSGCGKSTLARCLALWEVPDTGQVLFHGRDISRLSARESRKMRPRIQLVVQDSAAAFNPNLTAKDVVEEPLLIQGKSTKEQREIQVEQLFRETGLQQQMLARKVLEFSGGERQRLAIARALTLKPELIIFDEATTGLDRETQQQIITLLRELKRLHDLTYLVISHDLEFIEQIADSVACMRDGAVVSIIPACQSSDPVAGIGTNQLPSSNHEQEVALEEGA